MPACAMTSTVSTKHAIRKFFGCISVFCFCRIQSRCLRFENQYLARCKNFYDNFVKDKHVYIFSPCTAGSKCYHFWWLTNRKYVLCSCKTCNWNIDKLKSPCNEEIFIGWYWVSRQSVAAYKPQEAKPNERLLNERLPNSREMPLSLWTQAI